jgi:hypothetical protein
MSFCLLFTYSYCIKNEKQNQIIAVIEVKNQILNTIDF